VFNAKGYTLQCDCHLLEIPYDVLTEMAKNGEFTARVTGVFNVYDATRKEDMERAIAERTKYDVEGLFTIDTLKYFADGTPSMIEPFVETAGDLAGGREPLLWDEEHMMESMAEANKEGFNVHTHAMGSYAMRRVIDCY
jgi:predicted amidohydrolase YtcJ